MATLQTIRNRAGFLVAIVIGLALIAFILSDLFSAGGFSSGPDWEIAKVKGKSLNYMEYENIYSDLIESYKRNTGSEAMPEESVLDMIRDQAWDVLLRQYILDEEYKLLGVDVREDELFDMVQGNNIDPQIMQVPIFQNEATGMFDRSRVLQFLTNLDQDPSGNARMSWLAFERQLVENKKQSKYNSLIKKAIYFPNSILEKIHKEQTDKFDVRYVYKPYASIEDESVTYTESELRDYYKRNSFKFESDESRDIEYVYFDVLPSSEDIESLRSSLTNLIKELKEIDDYRSFVNYNSDISFEDKYWAKGSLNPNINSLMFNEDIGFIYGPYIEGQYYALAKLIDKQNMPDTVKARHILIQPSENRTYEEAKHLADSLKDLLEKRADFTELAMKYSDDRGSAMSGGDLGWFGAGAMVKPFETTAFEAKKGDINITETQFGIHIIQVTDRGVESPKTKIAFVKRLIEPSQQTRHIVYSEASKFLSTANNYENFNKSITDKGLVKRASNNLSPSERRIAGLESPREIIRWAHKSKKGDISDIFEVGDRFVVAAVTGVKEKGIASFDNVKEEVIVSVRKNKKAEMIINEMNQYKNSSLDEASIKLGIDVNEAKAITFNSFSMPGVGVEPNVIATATIIGKGKKSDPIKGNIGVFVLEVVNENLSESVDFLQDKIRLNNEYKARVQNQVYESLKKTASISDYRIKFF